MVSAPFLVQTISRGISSGGILEGVGGKVGIGGGGLVATCSNEWVSEVNIMQETQKGQFP